MDTIIKKQLAQQLEENEIDLTDVWAYESEIFTAIRDVLLDKGLTEWRAIEMGGYTSLDVYTHIDAINKDIVIAYDVKTDYETYEQLAQTILRYEKEAKEIEERLTTNK